MLLITHDHGVVSRLANHIAVMYACDTVEYGPTSDILNPRKEPKHPYTVGLLNAVQTMQAIEGEVRSPEEIPRGCRFYERCKICIPKCQEEEPKWMEVEKGHYTRCWRCESC